MTRGKTRMRVNLDPVDPLLKVVIVTLCFRTCENAIAFHGYVCSSCVLLIQMNHLHLINPTVLPDYTTPSVLQGVNIFTCSCKWLPFFICSAWERSKLYPTCLVIFNGLKFIALKIYKNYEIWPHCLMYVGGAPSYMIACGLTEQSW